ncbi:alcohol dehydrogenase [Candidatus Aerophobetes bacterium]|uniref:Alcohol dehydrogenase n=1 Tax=Aerophobetes bacterium TaxID=2030807 RepID=A0A523W225_UNCAE|nr:MAG: alcohol dehydrogenase [Candidatus Aerophobetes bacterium]
MLQAKLVAPEKILFEKTKIPLLGEKEVLIKVKICGVCGSDVHSYKGKHPFVHPPIVLGHEFSGVIHQIGTRVNSFSPGDRVIVEPNIVCGKCYNCLHGRYNICTNLKVVGCVGYDGAFAEYVAVPEKKVLRLPGNISFEKAALVEPVAVAVHAVRKAKQKINDVVVILGAGTIGLLVMQVAKLAGAGKVIVTDVLDYRLKKAGELGADRLVNPASQDLIKIIQEKYGRNEVDLIYDCVGIEETISQAIQIARKGIRIMVIGVPEERIEVDLSLIQDRELEIVGSLMYVREDFKAAIDFIQKERLKVKPLVTHHFKLKDVDKAFHLITEEKKEVLKVLIDVSD